jgi:hypothetical protein
MRYAMYNMEYLWGAKSPLAHPSCAYEVHMENVRVVRSTFARESQITTTRFLEPVGRISHPFGDEHCESSYVRGPYVDESGILVR